MPALARHLFCVRDYDLAATLASGQAFRWRACTDGWEGVVGQRWVTLQQVEQGIEAHMVESRAEKVASSWQWLAHYLQTDIDLSSVLLSFPDDDPMRAAVTAWCASAATAGTRSRPAARPAAPARARR